MACKKRDSLRKYLINNGIENKVFYSPLVCDAAVYNNTNKINVPMARRLLNKSISIPLHEKMTFKQVDYVVKNIHQFYE